MAIICIVGGTTYSNKKKLAKVEITKKIKLTIFLLYMLFRVKKPCFKVLFEFITTVKMAR